MTTPKKRGKPRKHPDQTRVYLYVNTSFLSRLFSVKPDVIRQWICREKLDPSNIFDIVRLYQERQSNDIK